MYRNVVDFFYFLLPFIIFIENVSSQSNPVSNAENEKSTVDKDEDEGKSSLVFVFDTTGSMYNDLRQLREGAEMILKTALEESQIISDFVFVPFHDPAVGPATVTRDKQVFKSALNMVDVYGGGDCPEKSLGGIQLALNVSRPRSFLYVFTDATAGDHRLVGKVLDAVQRKQSQVVFVLTGHCNDLNKPSFKVYQQIAAASSGQVFNLNKTSVHEVLNFVKSSIKGRSVNLGSVVKPAGYNFTQEIPVDSTVGEVTVSVSGAKPQIKVVTPSGEELTGPPKLVKTLDLSEIMVVKVLEPEPGNWSITVGSEKEYSVKVVGRSNLTFNHGFSVERPASMAETSYRPLRSAYNHMMLSLTHTGTPVRMDYAEILSLEGKTLFEVPLRMVDEGNSIYLADAFVPPDDFFYIAINGKDEHNQELRRIGGTAVQAKLPDVPYLTVTRKIEAHSHSMVVLKCNVESLVPVTSMWTKGASRVQQEVSSLQTTSVEYVIEDMTEANVGTYECVAKNVAGVSKAATEVILLVDPPQVTIAPGNRTLDIGEELKLTCVVFSEALLFNYQLVFIGTDTQYEIDIHQEPNVEGYYAFNKTISRVSGKDSGTYTCVAANRGGEANQTSYITIKPEPTSQILGPHTLAKLIHTDAQLVCRVDYADRMQWVAPNGSVAKERWVNGSCSDVLDVTDVTDDGEWRCVAMAKGHNASDTVELNVLIKPEASIEGPKNITILNGTVHEIVCEITAKPIPKIMWQRDSKEILDSSITSPKLNVYRSVLTLNSSNDQVNSTYFCIGENSAGIAQDTITVNVRRRMELLQGFGDKSVELYSQVELQCLVDSYPRPQIKWYHNATELVPNESVHLTEDNTMVYLKKVDFDNLGDYSCVADNVFETMEVKGSLSVHGLEIPVLSKETTTHIIRKGDSTKITCRIQKGKPEPTIMWQYKMTSSEEFSQLPATATIDDDNNLYISNTSIDNSGEYRCTAENVLGSDEYDSELIVQYPPQLNIDGTAPEEDRVHEVKAGEKVKFSCKAVGIPPPIIVWTKNGRPVVYTNNIHLSEESDLVILNATQYDSGLFTCNASSVLGSSQKNFTLFVYVPPKLTQPSIQEAQEMLEGSLVELPCVADGVPRPEIEWRHNGDVIPHGKKYRDEFGLRFIANLTDFGNYTCIAKNGYGNISTSYSIYIWVAPYIEPPIEIFKDVLIGDNVALQCDVIGFPIPSIAWEFVGKPLTENTTDLSFNDRGHVYITNASSKHEGVYDCVAENLAGVAIQSTYLRVNDPPRILEDNYTGPYIATTMDTSLRIACKATGKPEPYTLWSKDDFYLDKDSRYEVNIDGTLTIKSPSEDMSGNYTCIAKNAHGNITKTIEVRIYSLPTRMQADESNTKITVLEGTDASVQCPIRASDGDTVKWYKDAQLISTGHLEISNVSRTHASTYACVVANAAASAYAAVALAVEWPPRFLRDASPVSDVDVVRREDWYLDCGTDAKPAAEVKWLFNSRQLVFENRDRLKLMSIQEHNAGAYKCIVNNVHGTIFRQFNLNVLVPPFISEFDVLDVLLMEGTNATLECIAKGTPKPTIQWSYNNTNWYPDNFTLSSTKISIHSEGLYRCDAQNKAGATHLVYKVSVVSGAKVKDIVSFNGGQGVTIADSVEVVLGTRVRIACTATGKPVPSVQWLRNGNIVGENTPDIEYADLVLDSVRGTHAGVYTCIAVNEGGSSEMRIKVDVVEPPKIFQLLFQNTNTTDNTIALEVISGQAFYLHCHPYGNPLPEVYWFRDDLPLKLYDETMVSTEFGEVIVVKKAAEEHTGNYTCVARNKVGNSSVSYLVDVLVPPPTPKESSKELTSRFGKQLILTCPMEGSPVPDIMWIKHPYTEIKDETPRAEIVNENYTLIINNAEVSDSGKYSCIMTNKVGTTEVIFDVTIEKRPSIVGNVGSNIVEGHVVPMRRSIVLKCEVDGHPTPRITWLKETQELSDSVSNIHRVLGNSLLSIWSVRARDAGQYICVAENEAGAAHRRYNVAVQVPGKWSVWTHWALCDVTCGVGFQNRSRICHYVDEYNNTIDTSSQTEKVILDVSACKGPVSDRRKCRMPPCEDDSTTPKWSIWSKWLPCSATCGTGTQARTRKCKTKAKCVGDNVQIRKCPGLPSCPGQGQTLMDEFDGREGSNETISYLPEATYEMQPEVVNSHYSSDVEEFYIASDAKRSTVYYDVNVTKNLDSSDRGPCDPGYRHNGTFSSCDDIDECLIERNQCHSTQVCVNTAGAYRCTCPRGYLALGAGQRCLDINECEQDIHGCEYACVNVAGGYVCACPRRRRLHADKHHCVLPSSYQKPYEELGTGEYLSTAVDYPTKYTKVIRNT